MKQKRRPAYYLKIVKLQRDYDLIFIDLTPGTNGYGQKLYNHIKNNDGFHDEGMLLLVVCCHISQNNNNIMTNTRDNYPRRVIVCLVDTSTHENGLAILIAFKAFLSLPENNKFGYHYVVNDTSNLMPSNTKDLEVMDHNIQNDMIVNIIDVVYEDTDVTWYDNNRDNALTFLVVQLSPSGPSKNLAILRKRMLEADMMQQFGCRGGRLIFFIVFVIRVGMMFLNVIIRSYSRR